ALVTVLLTAGPAFGQNEAEKLYHAMEKKITSTKTIEAAFEAEMTGEGNMLKFKGKLYLGEDAKGHLAMEASADGKDMKFVMISDGKTDYFQAEDGKVDRQPADAKIMQGVKLFVARLGLAASVYIVYIVRERPRDNKDTPNLEKLAPIKTYKLGPKEKVGK